MISFGGGSSGSQQQSTQGFRDLPPEIQDAFKSLATQASGYIGSPSTTEMFAPAGVSAAEQSAIEAVNAGFSPTASSVSSDIALQMNPYDKYVIDEINRQSIGENSALQSAMNNAGQFGSNRMILGANDIDLSRLNQIGTFKQNQFNTSMNNALTTLPSARANDAAAQLQTGDWKRNLTTQTKQAPINALAAISSILGVLPTNSGQSSGSSSSGQWNFGFG